MLCSQKFWLQSDQWRKKSQLSLASKKSFEFSTRNLFDKISTQNFQSSRNVMPRQLILSVLNRYISNFVGLLNWPFWNKTKLPKYFYWNYSRSFINQISIFSCDFFLISVAFPLKPSLMKQEIFFEKKSLFCQ